MIYQARAKKIKFWHLFGKKRRTRDKAWEDAELIAKKTDAEVVYVAHCRGKKLVWYDIVKLNIK